MFVASGHMEKGDLMFSVTDWFQVAHLGLKEAKPLQEREERAGKVLVPNVGLEPPARSPVRLGRVLSHTQ